MSLSTFYYEPFYSLDEFHHLFDDAFNTRTGAGRQSGSLTQRAGDDSKPLKPRLDLHEDAENNTVTATFELPGLKKEDVSIDIQNNRLIVSGESKAATDKKEEGYVLRERRYGKFSRTLPLPQGTEAEKIKASFAEGVLTVQFPKAAPEQAAKRISIS